MRNRKPEILAVFHKLNTLYGKSYCYPSQVKILEILKKIYDIKICRRTLNYDLDDLESSGYITRIRRIRRGSSGDIEFQTTLYKITARGYLFLRRLGLNVVRELKALGVKFKTWAKRPSSRPLIEPGSMTFADFLSKKRLKFLKPL
jgi:hypothetical protein